MARYQLDVSSEFKDAYVIYSQNVLENSSEVIVNHVIQGVGKV